MGMTDEGARPERTREREEIKHTTQMNWSGAASSSDGMLKPTPERHDTSSVATKIRMLTCFEEGAGVGDM